MGSLLRRLLQLFGLLAFAALALFAQVGTFGPTGQQAVTASAVAVTIPAGLAAVCIQAVSTNAATVFIGNASVTTSIGYGLTAGQSACVPVQGKALIIYVIAASTGSSIQWFGTVQ